MKSLGVKYSTDASMVQSKYAESYPTAYISSKQLPELLAKKHNEVFNMTVQVRVIGINGEKPNYHLAILKAGMDDKPAEEMTPEEIMARIDAESDD